ncbi:MAG: toxic anion resistance protein [Eubacteriales bacterium]|jgi:uncharacterized protein YaaN involved in tellurite resistance
MNEEKIVLSLEPNIEISPPVIDLSEVSEAAKAKPEVAITNLNESQLTAEERKMIEEFSSKIDLNDSNVVLMYGAGAQKKVADFSEAALANVRTKDMGEVGDMISNLVGQLKSFSATEEEKGFLGLFKRASNRISALKAKYEKAEVNVEKIGEMLESHQIQLLKDAAMLDKLYDLNLTYFKEISMYILAGKKRLEQARNNELVVLTERAKQSGLPEDVQAARDFDERCNRFEKKLHDLELTRMISIQMAPQIRLVQNNDAMMVEKIQSTLINTIPLWKSQMVLALGIAHSQQAIAAQREVTNMTNELLRRNAEILKTGTLEAAKESERGIVDIETLKHTNETLISTLDEVMRIQEEGRSKRRAAEAELGRIEGELKQKLLQIRDARHTGQ